MLHLVELGNITWHSKPEYLKSTTVYTAEKMEIIYQSTSEPLFCNPCMGSSFLCVDIPGAVIEENHTFEVSFSSQKRAPVKKI